MNFIDEEMKRWDEEHNVAIDQKLRDSQKEDLKQFAKDGEKIFVCSIEGSYFRVSYQHWFVLNAKETMCFEFGGESLDHQVARVGFNKTSGDSTWRQGKKMEGQLAMSPLIRRRMEKLLGMRNYSFMLRNCQHVALYVVTGFWTSGQTLPTGTWRNLLIQFLMRDTARKRRNVCPLLVNDVDPDSLYGPEALADVTMDMRSEPFSFKWTDRVANLNADTYNILVLGMEHAGKSHLVNVLFNRAIKWQRGDTEQFKGETNPSVYFIRGSGNVTNGVDTPVREIYVANTISLCDDKDLSNGLQSVKTIKQSVGVNMCCVHAVIIVFEARTITTNNDGKQNAAVTQLKELLHWLRSCSGRSTTALYTFVGMLENFSQDINREEIVDNMIGALQLNGDGCTNVDELKRRFLFAHFPQSAPTDPQELLKLRENYMALRQLLPNGGEGITVNRV